MSQNLRDYIAEILFEELIFDAATRERDALDIALEAVTDTTVKHEVEGAAGLYAAALAEAAFVAGLQCGQDIRRLVCK